MLWRYLLLAGFLVPLGLIITTLSDSCGDTCPWYHIRTKDFKTIGFLILGLGVLALFAAFGIFNSEWVWS
jgi:hypothetical protein